MKKNFIYGTLLAVVAGATLTLASCSKDDDGNGGKIVVSIPSDSEATANPTLPEEANTTIPNLNYTVETENGLSAGVKLDGGMVGPPMLKRARTIMKQIELAGK